MKTVAVIAPHPDDETLGVGGTILKHRRQGDRVHWVIVTSMGEGYSESAKKARDRQIRAVANRAGFSGVHTLGFETSRLDELPKKELVGALSKTLASIRPEWMYIPFAGDAHSDHAAVSEAAQSSVKWFRLNGVRRLMAYETLSETGHILKPKQWFVPTVYSDITPYLSAKIKLMSLYRGETGKFPFPRSARAIRALAEYRGSFCGVKAAEAFMLLREFC